MSEIQDPKCWICGVKADTREHRIKKSDLVRAYGRGGYAGPSAPVHVRDGVMTHIQGAGSLKVKYSPSLCADCNNSGTQSFDTAYDQFISWVLANESLVLRKRFINFQDVYGSEFEHRQIDLFKYFVKSFGCRLVDAGKIVPEDLISLLPLESFRTALKITFCVNEDMALLPTRAVFLGKGSLFEAVSKNEPSIVNGYTWDECVSFLTICYWYGRNPEGFLGTPWIANSHYVYLGSFAPLSAEQRAEFLEKIRNDPDAGAVQ